MKSNITYAAVVYWIASVAATATLTTHIEQWNRYREESKPVVAARNVVSQAAARTTDAKLTAPYRDGIYMAKLAQQHGELRQAAVGRWATNEGRNLFSAGYDRGTQVTAGLVNVSARR